MKRYIRSSQTNVSSLCFDFSYETSYDAKLLEDKLYELFEDELGFEILGIDFRHVDYSDVSDYANMNTSQCGCDFQWSSQHPYDEGVIVDKIDNILHACDCSLLGWDIGSGY